MISHFRFPSARLRAKLRIVVQRLIETFLQRADIGQSRTSALNPLQWMLIILVVGLFLSLLGKAPIWVLIVLLTLIVIVAVFLVYCYSYFMRNNPDALRSEKFLFSKLAIERGMYGDSLVGLFQESTAIVPAASQSVGTAEKHQS